MHHQTKETTTTKIIGDKAMIQALNKLDNITLEELQANIEGLFKEVEDKAAKIYDYVSSLEISVHIDKVDEKAKKILKEYPILKHLIPTEDKIFIAKGANYIADTLKNWRINMLKENHNFYGVSISREFRQYREVRFSTEAQGKILKMFEVLGIYYIHQSKKILSNGDIVVTYPEDDFKQVMEILSITSPLTEKFKSLVNMDMVRNVFKAYRKDSSRNLDRLVAKIIIENDKAFDPLHIYCPFNSFLCKDRLKEISEKNVEQLLKNKKDI